MLTKFETKSNRVKGLSFHSKRPWILASLHSGVIQLWDYRMGTLIDRFDEHDGPVRGVHFHKSQPLFVSGGDDYKIKVWNYKLHRCLFTLLGHLDYIRTVQFHHEYPWIVSASDDQTIRIWNWQSRTCISVLTGHNHYVMCASFHPKEDLVVSASLDQTVRVWDIGALRKKTVSPADDILRLSQMNTDFFGGVDAVVNTKHSLHLLRWLAKSMRKKYGDPLRMFNKQLAMRDTKAWEVDTLRGHMNNVSCVLFHARQDIIVSNSEDKSIRVWDATKRTGLQTFRREHDRFWILAAHPEMNLLAAGHDSGMIVFKLERERPAYSVSGDSLFYVKDRFLRAFEYSSQKDTQLIPIRRPGSNSLNQGPRTLSYSPTENAVLICSDVDGDHMNSTSFLKIAMGEATPFKDAKRGIGGSAVFVARNRFAVLEKSTNQVLVKNLKNEIVKKSALPIATDAIFYAGTGNLLCRSEDRVVIFDLQQRIVLGDLQTSFVRYVVWSTDMETVALLSKHSIVIADKKLVHRCTLHETIRVKSGAWDDNGVFIYTTLTHIKYCLPNGDSGIIKTLDVPVYITKIYGSTIFCLDRDGKNRPIIIDSTEYVFKLSLLRKRYDQVMSMIKNSELCGQAMIAYLQQKGFPQVALYFVKDERTRFNLALESGNIEKALESAKKIDEKDYWYRLGVEALRQGNAGIFHDALYLGDVRERVKILENAGHLPLAYITASVHGLTDIAERLAAELGDNVPSLPEEKKASLLIPPSPVLCAGDWPLLMVSKGIFEGGLDDTGRGAEEDYEEAADADWGEALDIGEVDNIQNGDISMVLDEVDVHEENDEEGGWDLEDLDLPPDAETPTTASNARSSVFAAPTPGMPVSQIWVQRSSLAAEHAAAGNFDTAMRLLSRQLGIKNFSPLKSQFIDLHLGSHTYLHAFTSAPVISVAVERGWSDSSTFPGYSSHDPTDCGETRREVDEVKELIVIVKEYVLGLQMELKRRELKDDPVRQQELAAYFTHCNLQLPHMRLALSNAMTVCYNAQNMSTAANFARRLLETNPSNETSEKSPTEGRKAWRALTAVRHASSQQGEVCTVCDLSVIGSDASGLLCSPSQIR
ncbi:hypothetical protein DH2020_035009 [Rehmannia glutinosa]|uniref:Coatomer subunit alpha n=1 Tax=Rehmannia glutinosa TaxID=99300 RepID=A0ABR0V7P8_REHGL